MGGGGGGKGVGLAGRGDGVDGPGPAGCHCSGLRLGKIAAVVDESFWQAGVRAAKPSGEGDPCQVDAHAAAVAVAQFGVRGPDLALQVAPHRRGKPGDGDDAAARRNGAVE